MSAASTSTAAVRRRAMALPLICCPSCKQKVSCNFSHWEFEYVEYLVDKHYLVGDVVVDAIGEAEEQREQLIAARELVQINAPTSGSNKFAAKEASCGMSRQ
ncbi:hypothetical protein ZWY2020_002347 [Hordeum vulgare]|nr:hypothetical protein ZWY2020_002347 [Hordeum vulgare]